jgi:AcrR family transcriptional regulator
MTPPEQAAATRPRVEGDREQEVLEATMTVLADVGYDRLTMDAVAAAAKASKATLYRRWNGKVALVIDALLSQKEPPRVPDTGTLRGDLLDMFCGTGGLTDQRQTAVMGSILTAIGRDEDFAAAFRERFIGPRQAATRTVYERAHARGELRDGLDLDLLTPALAGIVLQRHFFLGEPSTPDLVAAVVDQIILPAVLAVPTSTTTSSTTQTPKDLP